MTQSDTLNIRVECYAGYRGEETPRRFFLGERLIEIEQVLDRWLDPDRRYFKVKAEDGSTYILCHDAKSDTWEMTMFNSSHNIDAPLSSTQ